MTAATVFRAPARVGSAFRWPLAAAGAALLMLAAAHGFEALGYAPCELCLKQREIYWAVAAVAVAGTLTLNRDGLRRYQPALIAVIGVLFLAEVWAAAYHAGVEWGWWPGPASCTAHGAGAASAKAISDLLSGAKAHIVRCDQAAWRLLGLSMAGWNALVALGLAVASAAASARSARSIRG